MSVNISANDILALVEQCSTTITLSTSDGPEWQRTSETLEVIDAKAFREALLSYIQKTILDGYD